MSRVGKIFLHNKFIGTIEETIDGEYNLEYTEQYVSNDNYEEMSLTLPKSQRKYTSTTLPGFFDGLIPEGWLLDHAVKNWKLNSQDRMGLLLNICQNTIGATNIVGSESKSSTSSFLQTTATRVSLEVPYSTQKCLISYDEIEHGLYSEKFARKMFGNRDMQYQLSISLDDLELMAKEQTNSRLNVTGVQRKLSLEVKSDAKNKQLTILNFDGSIILKPPSLLYPQMPEIEHLCMKMAAIAGFDVPECALIPMASGELAYIIKRFDRKNGRKLYQEDFCQLLEKNTNAKYLSSIEKCIKVIQKHCEDLMPNLITFFDINFYNYLIGNADMHLKNFSLVRNIKTGNYQLSPCYDFLSTKILVPEDKEQTALSINGKKNKLNYHDWNELALKMGLGDKHLDITISRYKKFYKKMFPLIDKSFLSEENKNLLKKIMLDNLESISE